MRGVAKLFPRRVGGFTLFEILLALVLFSVGMMALLRVLSSGIYADTHLDSHIVAMNLAQEKLEQLRDSDYSFLQSEDRNAGKASLGSFGDIFEREVLVSPVASDLKQITVNVFWRMGPTELKVSLVTYRTRMN